jgi:hypothetical protein
MDDHKVIVVLEYHAMADNSQDAIRRVITAIEMGENADLQPYLIRMIEVTLK